MCLFKKKEQKEQVVCNHYNCLDRREFVICEDCGVLVLKSMSHQISRPGYDRMPRLHYYCQTHKKPYDIIQIDIKGNRKFYVKNKEVDEKGKVL